MDPSILPETQRRYGESPVEIQVASVLMHAWSEVEHDLIYKPISGQVSLDERSILDGINGIVLSGEVFLERLQAAFEARVSSSGTILSNQYELAAFLYDHLRSSVTTASSAEPVMGRVDILFRLLQNAELTRLDNLLPYLENLDAETERRPLADQVVDRVLTAKPDLYEAYLNLRRAAVSRARSNLGDNYLAPEIVGSFLQKWTVLERFMRELARNNPSLNRGNIIAPISITIRHAELPEHMKRQLETIRRLRNNLIHGISLPEERLVSAADAELDELLNELASSDDPAVREAINWARSGEPDPPRDSPRMVSGIDQSLVINDP